MMMMPTFCNLHSRHAGRRRTLSGAITTYLLSNEFYMVRADAVIKVGEIGRLDEGGWWVRSRANDGLHEVVTVNIEP
jgi:hypothetical protein